MALDTNKLEALCNKMPTLKTVLKAGVISKRTARTVMDLDRWQMDDLHVDLIKCEAIQGVSSGTFRATNECSEYLKTQEENSNA